jgi:4-hydroxy-tetrahydrodipicolinate synthase
VFEGVFTALITPFRDGALDEPALRELIELQIAAGVDGIVPCGTTGESATLTWAEHQRVIEIAVETAGGRILVLAGTGSNNTREAVEATRHAKQAGADGALLISPYYNRPTQAGIFAHYAEVAHQTGFPLVVYNVPARTGSNIEPATLARLAELESVAAVKECSGDLGQVSRVVATCPEDFSVLAGDDLLTLPILAVGGRGVISTTSNVAPVEIVQLVRSFRSGEVDAARHAHLRLLPLFEALFVETNPIPVKAALAMRGLISEELRLPMVPLSDVHRERLHGVLKEMLLL